MATHEPASRLALGPGDAGRAVSAEEFAEAEYQEPWTYEREDGRLLVLAPEGQRHIEGTSPWWKTLVGYWLLHPGLVELVVPSAWVRPDGDTDRIGDIGVYLVAEGPTPPIPDRVPELMLEVVSPGRVARERDYGMKRREYYRLGVREYVVSDRAAKAVTVFARGPRGYRKRVLGPPDVYVTPLLPGLAVPLTEVL